MVKFHYRKIRKETKMSRNEFKIKAEVYCRDERCGKLAGLVLEPSAYRVTDLIVESGFLAKQFKILPLKVVDHTSEEGVYLSIGRNMLSGYPAYRVIEYDEPAAGLATQTTEVTTSFGIHGPTEAAVPMVHRKIREGTVPGQRVIEDGMPVKNLAGTVGKVEGLIVNGELGTITDLAMRRGLIFIERLLIPIEMVESIDEEYVFVTEIDEALERQFYRN
jgi:uncharacterized protein YrrD